MLQQDKLERMLKDSLPIRRRNRLEMGRNNKLIIITSSYENHSFAEVVFGWLPEHEIIITILSDTDYMSGFYHQLLFMKAMERK
jgi:hypothetical protein